MRTVAALLCAQLAAAHPIVDSNPWLVVERRFGWNLERRLFFYADGDLLFEDGERGAWTSVDHSVSWKTDRGGDKMQYHASLHRDTFGSQPKLRGGIITRDRRVDRLAQLPKAVGHFGGPFRRLPMPLAILFRPVLASFHARGASPRHKPQRSLLPEPRHRSPFDP
mmetsp:Transcript_26955/g.90625  ORF Transcript_26955/g.90625 Transcript_26955/m.90625 type:complete len:166 (-) Transcript_26955:21-518(-)